MADAASRHCFSARLFTVPSWYGTSHILSRKGILTEDLLDLGEIFLGSAHAALFVFHVRPFKIIYSIHLSTFKA